MKKFDVQIALEGVADAHRQWRDANKTFNDSVNSVMTRLLHEAAKNFLSVGEVASRSGLSEKRVRLLMRRAGLDPKKGKTLLAKTAADALASNAELMGIEPHQMDLLSPLAYLPMGDALKQQLTDARVHRVTELPEDSTTESRLRKAFSEPTGWLLPAEHVDEMVAHLLSHLEADSQ